jgi:hypothetical protein
MRRRAIWSLRLRLHSGLRQQGRRLRRCVFMARLKPCPFEGSVVAESSVGPTEAVTSEGFVVAKVLRGDGASLGGRENAVGFRLEFGRKGWCWDELEEGFLD